VSSVASQQRVPVAYAAAAPWGADWGCPQGAARGGKPRQGGFIAKPGEDCVRCERCVTFSLWGNKRWGDWDVRQWFGVRHSLGFAEDSDARVARISWRSLLYVRCCTRSKTADAVAVPGNGNSGEESGRRHEAPWNESGPQPLSGCAARVVLKPLGVCKADGIRRWPSSPGRKRLQHELRRASAKDACANINFGRSRSNDPDDCWWQRLIYVDETCNLKLLTEDETHAAMRWHTLHFSKLTKRRSIGQGRRAKRVVSWTALLPHCRTTPGFDARWRWSRAAMAGGTNATSRQLTRRIVDLIAGEMRRSSCSW